MYHITGQIDLDVLASTVTYTYQGCFVDQGTRDLEGTMFNMGDQGSTRICAELCVGYTYFGTQAGQQCFCGMTYGAYGAATDDAAECNSECPGHATGGTTHAMCGGSWRNSVYEITSAAFTAPLCGTFDEFSVLSTAVSAACCGPNAPCVGGLPTTCSGNCATNLLPMQAACSAFLSTDRVLLSLKGTLDAAATRCGAAGPPPGGGH